jgi:DNA-binding transcriptional regulator YhcF (GntR family)
LVGRRGKKKALLAVGHKIIIAVYHILSKLEEYKEPVLKPKSEKSKRKSAANYLNKLKELGLDREEIVKIFQESAQNKGPIFTEP